MFFIQIPYMKFVRQVNLTLMQKKEEKSQVSGIFFSLFYPIIIFKLNA